MSPPPPPGIALICTFNGTHKEFSQQNKLLSRNEKRKSLFLHIRKLCDKIDFVPSFDLLLLPNVISFLLRAFFQPAIFLPTHRSPNCQLFVRKISKSFVLINFSAAMFLWMFYLLSKLRLIVAFDSPRSFLHQTYYINTSL